MNTGTPVTSQAVFTTCNPVQSNYKSSQILTLLNFKLVSSPWPSLSRNYIETSNISFIHNMALILLSAPSTLHNILGFLNANWVQWTESGNERMGLKNQTRYEMKLLMTEMIHLINRSTDILLTQWEIKCNNQHLDIYDHQALLHLTWQKRSNSSAMA